MEERRRWYRDLWIFLAVFVAVPAVLPLGYAVPQILIVAVPAMIATPVLVRALGKSERVPRAVGVGTAFALFAFLVAFGPQIVLLVLLLLMGAS